MKKKIVLLIVFVFLCSSVFVLTGRGNKKQEIDMNQPAEDGKYHYQNKGLGFSIVLPAEFIYYQTQRKEADEYKDIEFFVPTTTKFKHEVPGYAKPIVVRVFGKPPGEEVDEHDKNTIYNEIGVKNGKVYIVKFWDLPPNDWKEKWTDNMKNELIESFKILE